MAKKKKSGNTMLRMDPAIHARAEKTADALGISLNALLNLIVRSNLPFYEGLARNPIDWESFDLSTRWSELNPGRDLYEFYIDLNRMSRQRRGLCVWEGVPFADGKLYQLNEQGNDFEEFRQERGSTDDETK